MSIQPKFNLKQISSTVLSSSLPNTVQHTHNTMNHLNEGLCRDSIWCLQNTKTKFIQARSIYTSIYILWNAKCRFVDYRFPLNVWKEWREQHIITKNLIKINELPIEISYWAPITGSHQSCVQPKNFQPTHCKSNNKKITNLNLINLHYEKVNRLKQVFQRKIIINQSHLQILLRE